MMSHPRHLLPWMALACLAGCGGGEDVTAESLARARKAWDGAEVRDYNLEWKSSGAREGHYLAYVRGGKVKAIRAFVMDRRAGKIREIEVKPGDPSYYGVEGLFKIIEEERAQLLDDNPFGQPKGTQALLKFTPDPRRGFPKSYRRDVVGSPKGLAIDVIRFVPDPPAAIPPPAP